MTKNNWTKWQEFLLNDFIDFNPSAPLKKGAQAKKVDMDKLAPYTREITGYTKDIFKSGSKFSNGDTLLARITPCLENGKTAFVDILDNQEFAFGSTEFIVLRGKEGISDSLFIYYLARSPQFRDKAISFMTGTSGRQRVELTALKSLSFNLPPFDEQKRIAGVLGAFDDKIELLQKQNKTLEDMAKAIFKSWFVDFDIVKAKQRGEDKQKILSTYKITEELYNLFPSSFTDAPASSSIGPIPTGWEVKKLKSCTNIVYGKGLSTSELTNKGYPVFGGNGIIGCFSKYLYKEPQVIISCRGAASGKIYMTPPESFITSNSLVCEVSDRNQINRFFLKYILEELNMCNYATGSAQPQITIDNLSSINIYIPNVHILQKFYSFAHEMEEKILSNQKQIQTLTELRDGLLPRLISGKLQV